MYRLSRTTCLLLAILFTASAAQGHYLWVIVDRDSGEHGLVNVYFEEVPHPGDGGYLDPFISRGKTWVRSLEADAPISVKMEEKNKEPKQRWLSGNLPGSTIQSADSYGLFGVYRYGKTDVLLHYYARYIDAHSAKELQQLARAEHLDLDIIPEIKDEHLILTVLWHGEPAVKRDVILRGPEKFSAKLQTDENGQVNFKPAAKGTYLARTSVEEPDKSGEFEEKTYELVRHNATLTLNLPIE